MRKGNPDSPVIDVDLCTQLSKGILSIEGTLSDIIAQCIISQFGTSQALVAHINRADIDDSFISRVTHAQFPRRKLGRAVGDDRYSAIAIALNLEESVFIQLISEAQTSKEIPHILRSSTTVDERIELLSLRIIELLSNEIPGLETLDAKRIQAIRERVALEIKKMAR